MHYSWMHSNQILNLNLTIRAVFKNMAPIISYTCKIYGFSVLKNRNKKSALNILFKYSFGAILLYKTSCQVHLLKSYDQNTVWCYMYHTENFKIIVHGVHGNAAYIVGHAGTYIACLLTPCCTTAVLIMHLQVVRIL